MKQGAVIFILVTVLACGGAYAQRPGGKSIGDLLRGTKTEGTDFKLPLSERGNGVARSYVENKELRTSDRWTADTAYYREVKRVNGWLEGAGKALRKTEITNGAPYFRLTRHTPANHYLRVEYIGEGESPEAMQIVLLSNIGEYDYRRDNTEGLAQLANIENGIRCIDFTPSADGQRVLLERATDKDGRFCHQLSLERISDDKAVGFYSINSGGMLSLTDERYTAPTGVIFEYAKDGSVKTITPIDATGWPIARIYED